VAVGGSHTCSLSVAANLTCWGNNNQGQLGIGRMANLRYPTAVKLPGLFLFFQLWCIHTSPMTLSKQVWFTLFMSNKLHSSFYEEKSPALLVDNSCAGSAPLSVATGDNHTCAVLIDGGLMCWGANSEGQLGIGNRTDAYAPAAVNISSGEPGALLSERRFEQISLRVYPA
jgi:alpha-tubulin suppressor-like RCC1 family protein